MMPVGARAATLLRIHKLGHFVRCRVLQQSIGFERFSAVMHGLARRRHHVLHVAGASEACDSWCSHFAAARLTVASIR